MFLRCLHSFSSEMVGNMRRIASCNQELTVEERNLLSVAYKNVIGACHVSWRIVSSIEQKKECKGNEAHVSMIKGYHEKIKSELAKICSDSFARTSLTSSTSTLFPLPLHWQC